ncbi:MAG: hemerythrin domain-containing protein [Myxococcota bacterium]
MKDEHSHQAPGAHDVRGLRPGPLVDHLEAVHHVYLKKELPRVADLLEAVLKIHGQDYPELSTIAEAFAELQEELLTHLHREEDVVFPAVRNFGKGRDSWFGAGGFSDPLFVLGEDHQDQKILLEDLRRLTNHYQAPSGADPVHVQLFGELAALDADLVQHMFEEDELLFPMVARGER